VIAGRGGDRPGRVAQGDRDLCVRRYRYPALPELALSAAAQVHATLALAAAIALSADLPAADRLAWRDVAATPNWPPDPKWPLDSPTRP
jgi:hypothetical protein